MVNRGYKVENYIIETIQAKRSKRKEYDCENNKMVCEIKLCSLHNKYARFIRKNYFLAFGYALATRKKFVILLARETEQGIKIYLTNAEKYFEKMKDEKNEVVYIPAHSLTATDITHLFSHF